MKPRTSRRLASESAVCGRRTAWGSCSGGLSSTWSPAARSASSSAVTLASCAAGPSSPSWLSRLCLRCRRRGWLLLASTAPRSRRGLPSIATRPASCARSPSGCSLGPAAALPRRRRRWRDGFPTTTGWTWRATAMKRTNGRGRKLSALDREALERCISIARSSSPNEREMLDRLEREEGWFCAAVQACYHCQRPLIAPRLWQPMPHDVDPGQVDAIIARGPDGLAGEYQAARLLRRMLRHSISRYEPDP